MIQPPFRSASAGAGSHNTTPSEIEKAAYLIQFIHPDKKYAGFPGKLDEAAVAAMFGVTLATYRGIKAEFARSAQRAAEELLLEPGFAQQVERLPFTTGAKVVGLGDSLTDDDRSWFEILRRVIDMRLPERQIAFINAGISAETSTEIFKRFIDVIRIQPDWILCAAGANDTWYWTDAPLKLSVSLDETERNLSAMRQLAALKTTARWLWMTPPTMIPDLVMAHWYQGAFEMMTSNEHLGAIADAVRRLAGTDPLVDMQSVFGVPGQRELFMDDGLHPSLAGHQAIVRTLMTELAT